MTSLPMTYNDDAGKELGIATSYNDNAGKGLGIATFIFNLVGFIAGTTILTLAGKGSGVW